MAKRIVHGTKTGYGYGCRCDECRAAAKAAARAYYLANKARILERNKAYYYANHEEQKAKGRERAAKRPPEAQREATRRWRDKNPGNEWRKRNPERDRENARRYQRTSKAKAYKRQWLEANRDLMREYQRDWQKRNPEKVAAWRQSTRAKRKQAEVRDVTSDDWRRLVARYRGECAYCGQVCQPTIDHVVPLSRGGRHSIGNIVPACWSCNFSKNARTIVEWRAVQRR